MNNRREELLERLLDRELKRLPLRKAPPTLMPRVLASIRAQAQEHWWQRPLNTWAPWLQILTLITTLVIAGFLAWSMRFGLRSLDLSTLGTGFASVLDRFGFVWTSASVLGNAMLVVVNRIHPILIAATLFLGVVAYASCIGAGTVLYRFVTHKS